jgi:2-polyprenyl-3-methyl-5-hydroxy-6-metoxy-1,4-benzoquinol methylase
LIEKLKFENEAPSRTSDRIEPYRRIDCGGCDQSRVPAWCKAYTFEVFHATIAAIQLPGCTSALQDSVDHVTFLPAPFQGFAMTTEDRAWYVDFFDSDYLDIYDHIFTAERSVQEVAFAERVLGLEPGAWVLDLCCGQGRHSVPLAQHGYRVTALDLSPAYLELAQQAAQHHNVELETISADMREIPFQDCFDAVINMYSSFGYLESEADDAQVLASVAKAMKPGGRFFLDMLNREWAVANYIQNDWHSGSDGTLYIERRDLDLRTSRMRVRFTIVGPDGGRRDSIGHDIRLYTLTELIRMLSQAGLSVTGTFGGFNGEEYSIDHRRMIIAARKDA